MRPIPFVEQVPRPVLIVTDMDSEHHLPVLLHYHMPTGEVWTASFLAFRPNGFTAVGQLFHEVNPLHQCLWTHDCYVRIENANYRWFETIAFYAGVRISLYEVARDFDVSDQSTCSSTLALESESGTSSADDFLSSWETDYSDNNNVSFIQLGVYFSEASKPASQHSFASQMDRAFSPSRHAFPTGRLDHEGCAPSIICRHFCWIVSMTFASTPLTYNRSFCGRVDQWLSADCSWRKSLWSYQDSENISQSVFRDHFVGLPPPGNPALFKGDLHTLDDGYYQAGEYIVQDYQLMTTGSSCQLVLKMPGLKTLLGSLTDTFSCQWPDLSSVANDLPLSLLVELLSLPLGTIKEAVSLDIFTDGSFFREADLPAGWTFVVFGYGTAGQKFLLHAACGQVVEVLDERWHLADAHSSRAAELEAALFQAGVWRLASAFEGNVCFHFDASCGYPAGIWNFGTACVQGRVVRAIFQTIQAMFPGKQGFAHVKAHSAILGNELADVLAKAGCGQDPPLGVPQIALQDALFGDPMPIELLWLYVQSAFMDDSYPELEDEELRSDVVFSPVDKREVLLQPVVEGLHQTVVGEAKIDLGVLTYNVGSFFAVRQTGSFLGRCEYIRQQLVSHGVHIACFQETRSKQTGVFPSATHFRFVAAANNGRGGCEIWLLRMLKGTSKQLLRKEDVIVHWDAPELLILQAKLLDKMFLIISGHAPHVSRPECEHVCWWNDLMIKTRGAFVPGQHTLVCGLDANTHFAQTMPPHVGEFELESKASYSSQLFLQFLQEFGLYLPSTWHDCQVGSSITWTRGDGKVSARCDYVALSLDWRSSRQWSTLLPSLDAGTLDMDHSPLAVWVHLLYLKTKKRQLPQFDRQKIIHMSQEDVQDLQVHLPIIPWQVNVHNHAMRLTKAVSAWLERRFPAARHPPRATFIQQRLGTSGRKGWCCRDV